MQNTKGATVIISTYSIERFQHVTDCIKSLKRQSLPPKEIFLVLDPDEALLDFYKSRIDSDVRIIVSGERGLSNARNTGIKSAGQDIVAFIDDDAIAGHCWLENLVKNYTASTVMGVGGLIRPIWEGNTPVWFPEELLWIVGCSYKGLPNSKEYVRNPIGCNMSFRRDIVRRVGYFDVAVGRFGKQLLGSEETEFSVRILEIILGSKILFDPSAVVYHRVPKVRRKFSYILKRSFYEGLSKAIIAEHNLGSSGVLSTERHYLDYLFKVSIPSRLNRIYKLRNACHLMLLFVSVCMVIIGFSLGILMKLCRKA
ncbi:MAG: glycosyltransferase [Candidatus Bathyarchaeota archaeon]|nr:glycosyltransferase [Candidatus Bathyarchaeota archaeon]